MTRKTALVAFVLFPLSLIPSCVRDFDQFDPSGDPASGGDGDGSGDGDGDLGGSDGDGDGDGAGDGDGDGTGDGDGDGAGDGDGDGDGAGDGDGDVIGDGDTGTGGSIGGAPNTECDVGEKLCDDECISNNDPQTSCGEASCSPCPSVPNAEIGCNAGVCSVGACEEGFVDCDDMVETGCEHSPSTDSEFRCGGCSADCTSLGLSDCQNRLCGCAAADECGDTNRFGSITCTAERKCSCDGNVACQPGEICVRVTGNSVECRCGGDVTCPEGRVCCPGSTGPSCKQLDGNDASNCGACGWQCPSGQVCVAGTCQ